METIIQNIEFTSTKHLLRFRFDAGTSRGVLKEKNTFFIQAIANGQEGPKGWGEAAPLPQLSIDDLPDFEAILKGFCQLLSGSSISNSEESILAWVSENIPFNYPSIRFAFETALLDLSKGGRKKIFENDFYNRGKSMSINGLIWMGDKSFMLEQIEHKLEEGYDCIKMKIGAIDFKKECEILGYIRKNHGADKITLRVDANGAFDPSEALEKLNSLATYDLHSIEQPIKQGQASLMRELCKSTPIPIALDEELIGIYTYEDKKKLLEHIHPQYIILKPTLIGGIQSSREWILLAESMGIGWWMTSALESNIGLNAIAQFTSTYSVKLPQGLGTGQLYHNNIESPLSIKEGQIYYDHNIDWGL
jgi:o-succinylbenzoate synthase